MRPLLPSDPRRVGRYRMLARLGVGGMGRVLLGSGPDGRLVALKLVSEEWLEADGFRARFRGEVAASRKVSGVYTAAVIDADSEADVPWLASEYVSGTTLAEAVKATGGLPEAAVLRLAAGLASALAVIHAEQLVHRDLKPNNILLTDEGLRVIDFGIARATDNPGGTGFTHTGRIMGTAGYMSPEQAEGRAVTPASDVFCLGVVLAMACTGSGPFDGNSDPQTMYNIVHREPDLSGLPPRVRDLVARCLDKNPENRPTPPQLSQATGELDPVEHPWPREVHDLIARRRAEVAALFHRPGWGDGLARVVEKTRMLARTVSTPNDQPRRRPPDEAHDRFDAARRRLRELVPAKGAAATTPKQQHALRVCRDVLLILVGVLVGAFVTADLIIGEPIASDRQSLGVGTSELERALTHAGYFGAMIGFQTGGVAAAIVRWIVGKPAVTFGRYTVAIAPALGFVVGWLAEHDDITVNVVSIGVMEDVTGNGDEAGLMVLGVVISLATLGCAMWVAGRIGLILGIVLFLPSVAVGAAWSYLGASGIVIDDSLWIGVATVVGCAIGGGVAARILKTVRDRRPPAKPQARAW